MIMVTGLLTAACVCSSAALPPGFDLRDCLHEDFADVPATVDDYVTNQPSRCSSYYSIWQPRVGLQAAREV